MDHLRRSERRRDRRHELRMALLRGIGTQDAYRQAANPAHNGCAARFDSPTNPSGPAPRLATWHPVWPRRVVPRLHRKLRDGGTRSTSGPSTRRRTVNGYLFSDYGQDWIKSRPWISTTISSVLAASKIRGRGPVDFAVDPISGDVFYVAITLQQVRRIRYTGSNNEHSRRPRASREPPHRLVPPHRVVLEYRHRPIPTETRSRRVGSSRMARAPRKRTPDPCFHDGGHVRRPTPTVSDGRGGTDINISP